jgi:hypothetical protein
MNLRRPILLLAMMVGVMPAIARGEPLPDDCDPPCDSGQTCYPGGRCLGEPEAGEPPRSRQPSAPDRNARPQSAPDPSGFDVQPAAELVFELISSFFLPKRHEGFMARVAFGLGGASVDIDAEPTEVDLSGLSGAFSIDLGGSLVSNLILHGRFAGVAIADPSMEVRGDDLGRADDLTAVAFLVGPGLTYYFMPLNVYLSLVTGLSWLDLHYIGGESGLTDAGLGFNLDVGKEWWLTRHWGVGLGLRFWFSHTHDEIEAVRYTDQFTSLLLLFSATYE